MAARKSCRAMRDPGPHPRAQINVPSVRHDISLLAVMLLKIWPPPGKPAPQSPNMSTDRDTTLGLSVLSQESGVLRLVCGPSIQSPNFQLDSWPPSRGLHLPAPLRYVIMELSSSRWEERKWCVCLPDWAHENQAHNSLSLWLDVDEAAGAGAATLQGKS